MRVVNIASDQKVHDFAKKAAEEFAAHPTYYTYAESDPKPGELFAIRWNSYTVLVLRLDDDFEPACYPTHQLIGSDLPKFVASPIA